MTQGHNFYRHHAPSPPHGSPRRGSGSSSESHQQRQHPESSAAAGAAGGIGARPAALGPAGLTGSFSPSPGREGVYARINAQLDAEDQFRRVLRRDRGLMIVPMADDGNCLFRAVAHQVYGDASLHGLVRLKCVDYLEAESGFFRNYVAEEPFEQYCASMRRHGVWGDNLEIQAVSEMYSRPVEVYAYQPTPLKTYQTRNGRTPLRLSYHLRSHYNSIVPAIDDVSPHSRYSLSPEAPGVEEDRAIQVAKQRNTPGALSRAQVATDLEATDLEQVRLALAVSRTDFGIVSSSDLDRAVSASLDAFNHQSQRVFDEETRAAEDVSLADLDAELTVQDDIQRAIQQSLREVGFSASAAQEQAKVLELRASAAATGSASTSRATASTSLRHAGTVQGIEGSRGGSGGGDACSSDRAPTGCPQPARRSRGREDHEHAASGRPAAQPSRSAASSSSSSQPQQQSQSQSRSPDRSHTSAYAAGISAASSSDPRREQLNPYRQSQQPSNHASSSRNTPESVLSTRAAAPIPAPDGETPAVVVSSHHVPLRSPSGSDSLQMGLVDDALMEQALAETLPPAVKEVEAMGFPRAWAQEAFLSLSSTSPKEEVLISNMAQYCIAKQEQAHGFW